MNDNMGGQNNPMFNMMSQGINVASDARSTRAPPNLQPRPEPGGARTMRGPQGVDEILQNLSKGGGGTDG